MFSATKGIPVEDYRVTCVVPTFNRPELLDRCLDSIKNQTMLPSKVVIAENGNSPFNQRVIDKYRDSHLVIKHLKSATVIPAWNNWMNGFQEVETKLVKIVWDDDWLEPQCIEKLVYWKTLNQASVVLCAAYGHVNSTKYDWYTSTPEIATSDLHQMIEIITRRMIPNSPLAGLHETEDVISAMNFEHYPKGAITPNLIVGIDYAMNIWALLRGKRLYFNPTPLVNMFSDGTNMTEVNQKIMAGLYKKTVKNLIFNSQYNISLREKIMLESMRGNRQTPLNYLAGKYTSFKKN